MSIKHSLRPCMRPIIDMQTIILAIEDGNYNEVEKLITEFIQERNQINDRNSTSYVEFENECVVIFLYSLNNEKYDIFRMLTKYLNVDSKDLRGNTLLIRYIQEGFVGYNNHHVGNKYFNKMSKNRIMLILEYTKNINLVDICGDNALYIYMEAIKSRNLKYDDTKFCVIHKMLELGVDILCNQENNAFNLALESNYYDLLEIFLNRITDDKIIITALLDAVEIGSNYDIVELLLRYVDDINAPCPKRKQNIKWLVGEYKDMNDQNIIELLEENGAHL